MSENSKQTSIGKPPAVIDKLSTLLGDLTNFTPQNSIPRPLGGKRKQVSKEATEVSPGTITAPPKSTKVVQHSDAITTPRRTTRRRKESVRATTRDDVSVCSSADESVTAPSGSEMASDVDEAGPSRPPESAGTSRASTPDPEHPPRTLTVDVHSEDVEDDSSLMGWVETQGRCRLFYTVSPVMMSFLSSPVVPVPEHIQPILDIWRSDEWDHLINPPALLCPVHFLMCLNQPIENSKKTAVYMRAANNLAIARASNLVWTCDGNPDASTNHDPVPYPQLAPTRDPPQPDTGLGPVLKQLTEATVILSETARGVGRDADRNAALFRTAMTDTTQGLKTAQLSLLKEIEELTGNVSRSTTPNHGSPALLDPKGSSGNRACPPMDSQAGPSGKPPASVFKVPTSIKRKPKHTPMEQS